MHSDGATHLGLLAVSGFLLCPKQPKAQDDFHQYHEARRQSTRGPLKNTPGNTGGKSVTTSGSLTFILRKGTKQFIINHKETLTTFQKPLRQAFQMRALSKRCFPTAKEQLFCFVFISQLHLLKVIVQHPARWPGAEGGEIQAKEKLFHAFPPSVPCHADHQSPPQVGGLFGHSAFEQGDFIQVPHGDVSDDLRQVLVKQRENDNV